MINACATKYNKDTSKDNSLFLFQQWPDWVSLAATRNKNPSVVQQSQFERIIFHFLINNDVVYVQGKSLENVQQERTDTHFRLLESRHATSE